MPDSFKSLEKKGNRELKRQLEEAKRDLKKPEQWVSEPEHSPTSCYPSSRLLFIYINIFVIIIVLVYGSVTINRILD